MDTRLAPATIVFIALLFSLSLSTQVFSNEHQAQYTFQADGLACPFCAYGIEKQFHHIEGVASVETDVASGTVVITMKPGATLTEAAANRAVKDAGFTMRTFRKKEAGK